MVVHGDSQRNRHPPGDGPRELAAVKWAVLAVGAFVCAVALAAAVVLYTTVPQISLIRAMDVAVHSVDRFGDSVARLAEGMRESLDEAVHRVGNGRAAPFAADLSGWARVIDGDTIEVARARVRLHGVDAPESGQSCLANGRHWPCGQRATRALDRHIGGRSVACEERDRDRYGRVVAECRHAGRDVNAWLVAHGWALACRRYSGSYVHAEVAARAARRGYGAVSS